MKKSVLKIVYLLIVLINSALYVNAQCTTNAGNMNQTEPVYLCDNQCSEVGHSGAVLDGDDILEFVLFDPNNSSQVLARKSTPDFCFSDIPDGQYGITYHIAARAGNDAGGIVNPGDPCMDQSSPLPVTWFTTPVAHVSQTTTSFCGKEGFLNATPPQAGLSGYWSSNVEFVPINGGNVNDANTDIMVSQPGTHTFTWTVTNGTCSDVASVEITFVQAPNPIVTNAYDTVCGNSYNLNVITTPDADGQWSSYIWNDEENNWVIPTTPPYISLVTSPNTTVNIANYPGATCRYRFEWTETNTTGGIICQGTASKEVVFAKTPMASVGLVSEAELCGNSFQLDADTSGYSWATGKWISSNIANPFDDPNLPNATVTISNPENFGDSAYVQFPFVWTMTNTICITTDTMWVTFYQRPQANAELDDAVCGYEYNLHAQWSLAPSPNYTPSGVWQMVPQPSTATADIQDIYNNNSHVTVSETGVYQFVFRENNTNLTSCYTTDTVQIEFVENPIAYAGEDQDVCGYCATLGAISGGFPGAWLPNGTSYEDHTDPTTQVCTSYYGTIVYTWKASNTAITNNSFTCVATDDVSITFWKKPTPNILTDPADSTACGLTYYKLRAEFPGIGITGYWYCSTTGVVFENSNYTETSVTVPHYGYYDFYWIEETGPELSPGFCTDTAGPYTVHFMEAPLANAGGDTYFCGLTGQLNAIPSIGIGTWSTSSTEYINFEDTNDPNTTITSTIINTENSDQPYFEVIWTENYTNGCTDADTIKVVFATASNSYSEEHSICEGEIYSWNEQDYTETGTYTAEFTNVYGCDSIITLNLTVNPLPEQVVVSQNPENGILPEGTSGSITLENSIIETNYWVTMGGEIFTEEFAGTGSELSLGNNFTDGSYDIRSRNQYGCSLVQGIVNFVTEVSGTNKIVANVSFGTPASNFPANHVNVKLHKATTDNETIVLVAEQLLGSNGYVEFTDLETGDYYLGSFIQYPENYNVAEHVYYQNVVVHENATSIPMAEETVYIANIHHIALAESQGSNEMQGIVGATTNQKSLNPLKDMVVVLRNTDINEIIGVNVTNDNGQYHFDNITDNVNIQAFVTSFEHQDWIAFEKETGVDQTYNINFIVDGTSIYPQVSGVFEDIQIQNIEFRVFPNPAKEVLYISCDIEKAVYQIFDINGRLVNSGLAFSNSEINISDLVSGTYLIILSTDNGKTGIQKFVKQ